MKDFDAEIASLQAEIDKLKRAKDIFEALSPEYRLAIILHEKSCTANHTDGCGWFYEVKGDVHDWHGRTHGHWLGIARNVQKVSEGVPDEQLLSIISATRGY